MAGAPSEQYAHHEGAVLDEGTLRVQLESPLPRFLPTGTSTAIFCAGICFDRRHEVALELLIDGRSHRPSATRMPRPDVLAAAGHPRSYRSGWWTIVQVTASRDPGVVHLQGLVTGPGRSEVLVPLGEIPVLAAGRYDEERRRPAPPSGLGEATIAICMATYNPDPRLFAAQVSSLRGQSDERWICVVSDDCSDEDRFEQIREELSGDPRFVLSRSEQRLGFYRNFERALGLVPDGVELVALCDQDDRWDRDKLEVLRASLGDAQMVYSDQRLVDANGRVLRGTMWQGRRNNHTNLGSLLVANSVTGAAALFRRGVADLARPFPDTPGLQFHDHWLALVALASGEVAYVDRPLYDYVQHAAAIFGELTQGDAGSQSASRLGRGEHRARRSRGLRASRSRGWRAAYFCGYLGRGVQAETLLVRCASLLTGPKRRALQRYVAAERSPLAFAWLLLRPLRRLRGANETLGSELELLPGILWRWLIVPCAKLDGIRHRRACDATFPHPLDFEQKRLRRWRTGT